MTAYERHRVSAFVTVLAMVGLASTLDVALIADVEELPQNLIQRVIAQTTRSGISVRSSRELRAGTVNGKHQGWMAVETIVTPANGFRWTVLNEGGSERTRKKVFHELLKTESHTWSAEGRDRAALSPANYEFLPLGPSGSGHLQIRLKPKRADSKLVDGTLTVSADGYPLMLQGKLAKSPSFWVKSVTIVKRFERFNGIALPTSLETLADLRMFGQATFTMRYRYKEVNGRAVAHVNADAVGLSFAPSAQILALHMGRSH